MGGGAIVDANLLRQTADRAIAWLSELEQAPVGRGPFSLPDRPLPQRPSDPSAVLDALFEGITPGLVASAGPRYFGFVTGGALLAAIAGDWLASVFDQNAASSVTSPAAAAVECQVVRWLCDLIGLPTRWTGVMTSGGTMSNLVGMAAGREAISRQLGFSATHDGLAGNPAIPVVSSQAVHSSVIKSLGVLGIGRAHITMLPAPNGSVCLDALESHFRSSGQPHLVIANAGEVNTGQFDRIGAISTLAEQFAPGSWLHVDAAFGAFAGASPEYASRLEGIERADSVAGDSHKWLNVPYDSGFVLFRSAEMAQHAFTMHSSYQTRDGGFDADTLVPEFSRRFRALPAWCALASLGRAGYRDVIERSVRHADSLRAWIDCRTDVELVNREAQLRRPFCIVAFRLTNADWDEDTHDLANERAVALLNASADVYVTGTTWHGRRAIRVAIVNWSTTEEDIAMLIAAIGKMTDRISEELT